jgi:hypothetical protein
MYMCRPKRKSARPKRPRRGRRLRQRRRSVVRRLSDRQPRRRGRNEALVVCLYMWFPAVEHPARVTKIYPIPNIVPNVVRV